MTENVYILRWEVCFIKKKKKHSEDSYLDAKVKVGGCNIFYNVASQGY